MKLSADEIRRIINHLDGKIVLSRRKKFEQFSSGRGKILHRQALLYGSIVRELEKSSGKLKAKLVDSESNESLLILENSSFDYRRETRIPKEIASYLTSRFPQIVTVNPLCHPELDSGSCKDIPKRVRHDSSHSEQQ